MKVLNAMDIKAGAKAQTNRLGTVIQPLQFLPREEKDDEWSAWCCDWTEWEGLKQLRRKSRRLSKNYKLANGTIDRTDYIPEPTNESKEILDTLYRDVPEPAALELKFFPIIPNVINTLCSEFAKRNTKISFKAVDEFSMNDLLNQKSKQVGDVLMAAAEQNMIRQLIEMGVDPSTPEFQQQVSPDKLKTLPEIQAYYNKTYRSAAEEWATHQHNVDEDRFMMQELEVRAFRDSLITDSEYWHFKMMDDDYDIELWNPMLTFYHKSPNVRYMSQAHWIGHVDMMTIADVIDKYGHIMNDEQMRSLELKYPVRAAGYPLQGYQHETYYDPTRSHEWNVDQPGLPMRQFTSMYNGYSNGVDVVDWINRQNEDYSGIAANYLLRCTTVYWKSQRKVGYLTKIDTETGEVFTDIVDESYKVTDKPLYNNTLIKNKDATTLIAGEHIEWIWINEVWGGTKIGPNFPTFWGMTNPSGISPIYLGINQNRIGPLKFQFRGDKNLYGCKLPVEGIVYSDYNTKSTSLVDRMKPFQVMYNIVNNQIADILVDEQGTVLAFDPALLPTSSLGEDWGPNNYAKAWVAMKNFQVLPLNMSFENGLRQQGSQTITKLDLEQTNRLLSRVNLANFFKQQAYEVIGITPQRMGQQMGRQTATGVEEQLNASYAQTEMYFINHSDHLMPRVHQMRTDLAQYYNSTKPSLRLQYITRQDEKVNFQINGTDLLLRDINVNCVSDSVSRSLMEQLKKMAIENNTSGASLYDLGGLVMSSSIGEITSKLKELEQKATEQAELNHQREMEKIQAENEAALQEKQMQLEHDDINKEKDRRTRILEAEIRAAGYAAMSDRDANGQSDFIDFMKEERNSQEYQDTMNFETQKEANKNSLHRSQQDIEREKIAAQERMKQMDYDIAIQNKNRYDKKDSGGNKTKKK